MWYLGNRSGVDLPAAQLEEAGPTLLHGGGEVVAHLQHQVRQGALQQQAARLPRHAAAVVHQRPTMEWTQEYSDRVMVPVGSVADPDPGSGIAGLALKNPPKKTQKNPPKKTH